MFSYDLKPDCSVYAKDKYIGKVLKISLVDFIIEFKKGLDPFVDPKPKPKPNSPENLNSRSMKELNPFVVGSGLWNLGQITTYTTSILSTQYRMHTFMVFIVNKYTRLL